MGEERDGVTGNQPDELAAREDDLDTEYDRLAKVGETVADLTDERGLLEGLETLAVLVVGPQETNEGPSDGGKDKEKGCHGGGNGTSELEDQEGREEGTRGTGDLVEDVDNGVHSLQLDDIASDNITGDDTADELDHAVADTDDRVNGEKDDRIPFAVSLNAILGDLSPGRDVDDDNDCREETKEEYRGREDTAGGEASDEGGNGDGTNTLEGLVETLENTHISHSALRLETFGGEQGD